MVVLSDRLPGSQPGQQALTGLDGNPDDPVTTALSAVVARRDGVWIGRAQAHAPVARRVTTHRLDLDPEVLDGYLSHSQSTIWPLYHDLVRPASHDQAWRESFRLANHAFARAAAERAAREATVWVHDYQLQLVPGMLRRLRPDLRIAFYLTSMFPPADLIKQTPMHRELLSGLLGADLVGFQSAQAAENFLRLRDDLSSSERLDTARRQHEVDVGVYPTSVDTVEIVQTASRPDILRRAAGIRASLGSPPVVLLSIDPPSAAAGTGRRLRSLRDMLSAGVLQPQDIAVIQVVTDAGDGDETDVLSDVALEVARINGQFAAVGRPCVHFVRDTPSLEDRVALYLAADVLVATPLRDGATTPALEFAAVGTADSSVVVSEFSGTASVLPEAFLVNPYDDEEFRSTLVAAITAGPADRKRRMAAMRSYVSSYDTHAWARLFLIALNDDVHALNADVQMPTINRTDVRLLLRPRGRPHAPNVRPHPTRAAGHR